MDSDGFEITIERLARTFRATAHAQQDAERLYAQLASYPVRVVRLIADRGIPALSAVARRSLRDHHRAA